MTTKVNTYAMTYGADAPVAVIETARTEGNLTARVIFCVHGAMGTILANGSVREVKQTDVVQMPTDGLSDDIQVIRRFFRGAWRPVTSPWWDGQRQNEVVQIWTMWPTDSITVA